MNDMALIFIGPELLYLRDIDALFPDLKVFLKEKNTSNGI